MEKLNGATPRRTRRRGNQQLQVEPEEIISGDEQPVSFENTVNVEENNTPPLQPSETPVLKPSDPTEPTSAETDKVSPMRPDASLVVAGREMLKEFFHKLEESEPVAREGKDPEGVHDMRVATRRLRAGLKILEETVFDPRLTRKLRRELRKLANALGETRDSDVFLEHLREYLEKQPAENAEQLLDLVKAVEERNQTARRGMLKALDSKKVQRSVLHLKAFLDDQEAGVRKQKAEEHEAAPVLVRHFAGSAIWRNYEQILAYETLMPAPPLVLHRLRVACKHLRYTLNFFEDALLPDGKVLAKEISQVQDYLGTLQDHQVGIDLALEVLEKHPGNEAIINYHRERLAERDQMVQDFGDTWEKISGSGFRRRLAKIVAAL